MTTSGQCISSSLISRLARILPACLYWVSGVLYRTLCSTYSAIKILKDERLLLRNPLSFNDPFDTDVKRSKKDIKEVKKIITGFISTTLLLEIATNPAIADKVRANPAFIFARKEYQTLKNALEIYPRFDGNFAMTTLYKILGKKKSDFKARCEEEIARFESISKNSIDTTKKDSLATCFSKDNKSILMWSHYGKSHTGVCIEYDRPESSDFVDVVYSKRRPKLKYAELVSYLSAITIIGEKDGYKMDDKLIYSMVYPFIVKSIEWKYEKEVRCLITKKSNSENRIIDNGDFYYKMPLPTNIYIGCRAKGKELNELIKIAKKKKIKYVFLKTDEDSFSLNEK